METGRFALWVNPSYAAKTTAVALLTAACAINTANAQSDEDKVREQLGQMTEFLENAGLTPEQLQQAAAVLHGTAQQSVQFEMAEDERAAEKFSAMTAGFGSAWVVVDGARHELRVLKCDTVGTDGAFVLEAQKGPDRDGGHLGVYGAGSVNNSYMNFQLEGWLYESNPTAFEFDGQTLAWEGKVLGRGSQQTPLSLSLTCRP